MRTKENSDFTLYKTHTRDWYKADEVDKRIAELQLQAKELMDSNRYLFNAHTIILKKLEDTDISAHTPTAVVPSKTKNTVGINLTYLEEPDESARDTNQ
jgi:hypothetical protein